MSLPLRSSLASVRLSAAAPTFLAVKGCLFQTKPTTAGMPRLALLQSDVVPSSLASISSTQVRARSTRDQRRWVTDKKPWISTGARPIFQPYRGHFINKRGPRRSLNVAIPPEVPEWNETKRRTGLLAVKAGMVSLYDRWGAQVPCTILRMDNCQVVFNQKLTNEKRVLHIIQVGSTNVSGNQTKHNVGQFKCAGVPVKKRLAQFVVSPDAHIPVGTHLGATHFVPGQEVHLRGRTKDKGIQGVMKRWGFKGGPASHGSSKFHRKRGSCGASGPGRVMPGTKMPGRMGFKWRTRRTVVVKIDAHLNLIYVKGNVFGPIGRTIRVRDAYSRPDDQPFPKGSVPPYPTMTVDEYKLLGLPREVQMATVARDPFNREGLE